MLGKFAFAVLAFASPVCNRLDGREIFRRANGSIWRSIADGGDQLLDFANNDHRRRRPAIKISNSRRQRLERPPIARALFDRHRSRISRAKNFPGYFCSRRLRVAIPDRRIERVIR